jgi:lipopolysaccharide core heptose(I) kinase
MDIHIEELNDGALLINSDFSDILRMNGIDSPEALWNLKGESVKKILKERGTERTFLKTSDGQQLEAYLKRYLPLPLKEHLKGMTSFKPVFSSGALHEWESIIAFHRADIPTMIPIAAGQLTDGRSVNITLAITDYRRASDIFAEKPDRAMRIKLIENIAKLAGKMHAAKFAHQDFYLVHLFVKEDLQVLPIDLQRIIMGRLFKKRWQVKDLGELLFSAYDYVSLVDVLRFWKIYTDIVDTELYQNKRFIKSVIGKADRIRARFLRKKKKNQA